MISINCKVWSKVFGYGTVLKWHDFDHVIVRFAGESDEVVCHMAQVERMGEA